MCNQLSEASCIDLVVRSMTLMLMTCHMALSLNPARLIRIHDEMKPNKQLLTSTAASVTSVLDSHDAAVGALRMRKWQQCI